MGRRVMAGHGKTLEGKIMAYQTLLRIAEENNWKSLIPFYRWKIEELEAEHAGDRA